MTSFLFFKFYENGEKIESTYHETNNIDNHRCTNCGMLPTPQSCINFFPLIIEGTDCVGELYK